MRIRFWFFFHLRNSLALFPRHCVLVSSFFVPSIYCLFFANEKHPKSYLVWSRSALLCLSTFVVTRFIDAFVAPTAPTHRSDLTALQARGGGEYDISDADIQNFYNNLLTGAGGDPPKVGLKKKGQLDESWLKKTRHGHFLGWFTPMIFEKCRVFWFGMIDEHDEYMTRRLFWVAGFSYS